MTGKSIRFGFLALLASAVLTAQQASPSAPSNPMMDGDACMRHCKEMAEARQKLMVERKAAKDKRDAAWKEIRAEVNSAKNLKGDKKVAALESALEKLLAFHESMESGMGHGMMEGMDHPMGGSMGHGMMGMKMDDCPMMHADKPDPAAKK